MTTLAKMVFRLALPLVSTSLAGCAHVEAVNVDDLPQSQVDSATLIQKGDVLRVEVAQAKELNLKRISVGEDGKLALPKLGDVLVEGLTEAGAAKAIAKLLANQVPGAVVSVRVREGRAMKIAVLGEVRRPGVHKLPTGSTVLHALAAARGLTPFADDDRILLLRQGRRERPIRFAYKRLVGGVGRGAAFVLQPGDVVVVE
ncbi:MAG: polysaccharide biosynthesis/export family protein [Deltaproteobacteria bacterium]|nr:polysaccharide biosynthesis/export family protein [Deltaproteobacteria bacterium]